MKAKKLLIVLLTLGMSWVSYAQMPGGVPVEHSGKIETVGGKQFYIHVVQRGQTVYSIARAYGVKDYDAVVKKDIHFLSVGDTVWIPLSKVNADNVPSAGKTSGNARHDGQAAPSKPAASPADTPAKQVAPAVIKERVDGSAIVVSLLMPLYLSQISEISTTKFDVEQRGRKSYRQFEFIQFYEGVQMALQELQQQGISVRLNVVDVASNDPAQVERLWNSHRVSQSDMVLAMLPKESFERASQLAAADHLFIVNPRSTRQEIVYDNPYVVKCYPSASARIARIITYLQRMKGDIHLYVVHSKANAEKPVMDEVQRQLKSAGITYTLFDWAASGKLGSTVRGQKKIMVLPIYDGGKDRNRIFASSLLNKLSALSSSTEVTLVTLDNWIDLYHDIDLAFLNNMRYHTFLPSEWDYANTDHIDFLRAFYRQYHVEPTAYYAAMGHDAILYFVSGIALRGTAFWSDPNLAKPLTGMLRQQSFAHFVQGGGFESSSAPLYRLMNYQFTECR